MSNLDYDDRILIDVITDPKYDEFSYGVANRGASVRIPRETEPLKCGYFEDRRPSSNMDPYIATSLIFETCCL